MQQNVTSQTGRPSEFILLILKQGWPPTMVPDGQHVVRVVSSDWLQCPFIVRGESRLSTFNEAGRTMVTGSSYIRTDSGYGQ